MEQALAAHQAGNLPVAVKLYQQILQGDPGNVNALHLLGCLTHQTGNHTASIQYLQKAIALYPQAHASHYVLGSAYQALGRRGEAAVSYEKALRLKPDYIEALNNLGVLHKESRNWEAAEQYFLKILQLRPDYADGRHNLGLLFFTRGNNEAAIVHSREALRLNPNHVEALVNLANALKNQGEMDDAIQHYRKVLSLAPNHPSAHSNLLFAMNYHPSIEPEEVYDEHRRWATKMTLTSEAPPPAFENDPNPERRLRIGYVSPDFRQHPVAFFIVDLLAKHNRDRFEIFCYSNVANPDAVTEKLKGLVGQWRNIHGVSDREVIRTICGDQIDILIDLAGHTADNRLSLFVEKPAPVQVTYLAYPNTTGLRSINYRITDAWCDPPGKTEHLNSEELIRLPHSFFCFHPPENAPEIGPLPSLKKGFVTFGSFNNIAKISTEVLELWAKIMDAAPNSRLLMQSGGLNDISVRRRIETFLADHGVSEERLEMLGPTPFVEHLALHHSVDIALDSFPWCGHTTTCNTLWMGVPVVTLSGKNCIGRMGTSILSNLDLQELIAETPHEYVEKVVSLTGDPDTMQRLRAELRERVKNSNLTNVQGFANGLEDAFRCVWRRWCDGRGAANPVVFPSEIS